MSLSTHVCIYLSTPIHQTHRPIGLPVHLVVKVCGKVCGGNGTTRHVVQVLMHMCIHAYAPCTYVRMHSMPCLCHHISASTYSLSSRHLTSWDLSISRCLQDDMWPTTRSHVLVGLTTSWRQQHMYLLVQVLMCITIACLYRHTMPLHALR